MPSKLPILALLLIGSLLPVAAGHASAAAPAQVPFAFEEEGSEPAEEEFGEGFEGECEIAEEEVEEGLLTGAEAEQLCAEEEELEIEEEAAAPTAANQCPLRSARAHAAIRRNRLKLTIGYTTRAPTKVRVEVRAGKRKLGSYKRRLGRSGALRVTKRLGRKRVKKIRVRIMAPMCKGFEPRPAVVH